MIVEKISRKHLGTLCITVLLFGGYLWYFFAVNLAGGDSFFAPPARLQSRFESCGFAALAMYLSVQGVLVSEQDIIAYFSRHDWMSFAEMLLYVQSHGFTGRGLQVPPSFFLENSMLSIVHLKDEHYVVYLADLPGRNVLIFDPAVGYLVLPVAQLLTRMSGYIFYAHR